MRQYLPTSYIRGFADPDPADAARPTVWVHRAVAGEFQAAPVEPEPGETHFNRAGTVAGKSADLEQLLEGLEGEASRLLAERLPLRAALAPAERDLLSAYFALLGVRLSPRFADIDETEARRGFEELVPVLREMGWVFWEAPPPDYFVSSSAPFHAAFPGDDSLVQGMELHAPGVEITLPLTSRFALLATWRRRGELWRSASEAVLLELNARTIHRARRFVLAPKPAIPG